MSLPRALSVKKSGDAWVLLQKPVPALQGLRKAVLANVKNELLGGTNTLPVQSQQFELELELTPAATGTSGVRIASTVTNQIGYDAKNCFYLNPR